MLKPQDSIEDFPLGYSIVKNALRKPIEKLLENAGVTIDIIRDFDTVSGTMGYNVITDQIEDLQSSGIFDPTKVVRSGLENAVSVASLLLTTEAIVTELPEEKTMK